MVTAAPGPLASDPSSSATTPAAAPPVAPWLTPADAAALLRSGTGRGIRVAVIDSGVEVGHPRLAGLTITDDVAIVSNGLRLVTQPNNGQDATGDEIDTDGRVAVLILK